MGNILVTGGAGYIGSHVVKQLGRSDDSLIVLDNLTTSSKDAVLCGELIRGDVGDMDLVSDLMVQHRIDTVMHFAAKTVVPDSVADPLSYYENNTMQTRNLIQCCVDHDVQHFVFSSTAAVYGNPESGVASEETATNPVNPYGTSKLMSELMLRDACAAGSLRAVVLRYFNVAGCDPGGRIGQSTPNATLLVKVLAEQICGKRASVKLFGTDYGTRDGTCIRDYIHVEDLAAAHLKALDYLREGGPSVTLNCGYGRGFTVREVMDAVERAAGQKLAVEEVGRRPGDPEALIANADRIRTVLGWTPELDSLDQIVRSALAWERKLASQDKS
ncbi:MAG: UDP-glucose 4-epimerase GalE [Xanthomonadales bacterium]|nr:UDP-glucose 4-epimerase GalE [Xanthomonadales bacterium]